MFTDTMSGIFRVSSSSYWTRRTL